MSLQVGMFWGATKGSGGLDRIYTDLVQNLPGAGVGTIGLVEGPDEAPRLTGGVVQVYSQAKTGWRRYKGIRCGLDRVLRANTIDIVALHFAMYGAAALDRLGRQPLVIHFHGPWAAESRFEGASRLSALAKHQVEGAVYRKADRVIVLSKAFGELMQRDFGVPSSRVRLVPGHVDLDRFRQRATRAVARRHLGLPTDRAIIVTVRRLKRRMGLDRLIAAMVRIVARIPDVLLCIGGTGTLRAELEQSVAALGIDRNVRFLGYVAEADLPVLYRAADLNVVPTEALEGFGLVAAEALAAGTPSVVTPVGGLPEVVSPLSPSLVFASSEPAAMADRLLAILLGRVAVPDEAACESFARSNFSAALAAERTADVYREVVR